MVKSYPLELVSADGVSIPATAYVSTTPIPGSVWRDVVVRVEWSSGEAAGTGCDAFDALRAVREQLAAPGLVPRCFGACRNFVMSPMASQMGSGLVGHLVQLGHPAGKGMAGTFDTGPDMDLASIAEQEAFKDAWFGSLGLAGQTVRCTRPVGHLGFPQA